MKKIILVAMVLAAGYFSNAQVTAVYTVQSAGSNYTYSIPEPIYTNFQMTYPGATMVTWGPRSGWWYASYVENNNRINYVYYSTQPYYLEPGRDVNYKVALPVLNTYVPERVITSAINNYGSTLYSITAIRETNNDVVYQVCLMENGTARTVWMNEVSTVYVAVDKVRANNDK